MNKTIIERFNRLVRKYQTVELMLLELREEIEVLGALINSEIESEKKKVEKKE